MARRKSFMSGTRRTEDREAQRQAVGALFDNAGNLADPSIASRRLLSQDLPIIRIRPNPFQARRDFTGLNELADAIRAQGFTTRLRVRPDPSEIGFFQLVYGERRLRAAEIVGMMVVPCDIAEHSDEEMIEIGLAENIQRRDLDPLEEAAAFRTLIDQRGYSIRRLAERIGKAKGYIEGRLALLRVPEDVKQLVEQRPDTVDAAQQIAKIPTPAARRPLIEAVADGTISAQQVRQIVREQTNQPAPSASSGELHDELVAEVVPSRVRSGARDGETLKQLRRTVTKDVQTIAAIMARWRILAERGDDARTIVLDGVEYVQEQLLPLLERTPVASKPSNYKDSD